MCTVIFRVVLGATLAVMLSACGGGAGNSAIDQSSPTKTVSTPKATPTPVSIKISWDSNTEADLKGYVVYHGADVPKDLQRLSFVGKDKNSFVYTVQDAAKTVHYFSLTAVDEAGNESLQSNLLSVDTST